MLEAQGGHQACRLGELRLSGSRTPLPCIEVGEHDVPHRAAFDGPSRCHEQPRHRAPAFKIPGGMRDIPSRKEHVLVRRGLEALQNGAFEPRVAHRKRPQRFHFERALAIGILFEDARHQVRDLLRTFLDGCDSGQVPQGSHVRRFEKEHALPRAPRRGHVLPSLVLRVMKQFAELHPCFDFSRMRAQDGAVQPFRIDESSAVPEQPRFEQAPIELRQPSAGGDGLRRARTRKVVAHTPFRRDAPPIPGEREVRIEVDGAAERLRART